MIVSTSFSQGEPRRFDVVAAMHAYNDVHDSLLGPEENKGQGFFNRERCFLERQGRRVFDPQLSAFLFSQSHALEQAQEQAAARLADLRRGIASVGHFYEIADREGHYCEYGQTHHPRVPLLLSTVVLPSTHDNHRSHLYGEVRKARNEVCRGIEESARSFEASAHPDRLGYVPFLHAQAAEYERVRVHTERRFDVFGKIIRAIPED